MARTASEMAAADAEAMAAPPPRKRAKKAKPPPKKDQFGPRITSDDEGAEAEEPDADLVIDKVQSPWQHRGHLGLWTVQSCVACASGSAAPSAARWHLHHLHSGKCTSQFCQQQSYGTHSVAFSRSQV